MAPSSALGPSPCTCILFLLGLAGLLGQGYADEDCDADSSAAMAAFMETAKDDACLQAAIDDFNSSLLLNELCCLGVALGACILTVPHVLYPLVKKEHCIHPSVGAWCGIVSVVIGGLMIGIPLALYGGAWSVFFEFSCACSSAQCYYGANSASWENCWQDNAEVTGQDKMFLVALPMTVGVILVLVAFATIWLSIRLGQK